VPAETVLGLVGHGMRRLVEGLLRHVGASTDDLDADLARYRRIYEADPVGGTAAYSGAPAALDRLAAAGHGLAVCTQKPDAPARAILAGLGLAPPITGFTGGDSMPGVLKPDARLFWHAAAQLPPGRAIMIGDSETDAATARAAGVPFLLHRPGYRHASVAEIAPDAAFDDFRDLPALVAGLVLPWNADTNFMPAIGGVKVIPEALSATYDKLRAAIRDTPESPAP
jgi:phosphoglycolate phosphatase